MLAHYLATAFARFRRDPAATAIKAGALALGLACFLLAHAISDHVARMDSHWAGADRTFMLSQTVTPPNGESIVGTPGGISSAARDALREEFPEVAVATMRGAGGYVARAQGRVYDQGTVLAVDPPFFDIFDLALRHGEPRRLAVSLSRRAGLPRAVRLAYRAHARPVPDRARRDARGRVARSGRARLVRRPHPSRRSPPPRLRKGRAP
jgi:hypothetical protein